MIRGLKSLVVIMVLLGLLASGCATTDRRRGAFTRAEVLIKGRRVYVLGRRTSPDDIVQVLRESQNAKIRSKRTIRVCADEPQRETFLRVTGALRRGGYSLSLTTPPIDIEIGSKGEFTVGGKPVLRSELLAKLKELGAMRTTPINVFVDESREEMTRELIAYLNRAGYVCVLAGTGRKASAYVTPPEERRMR